MTPPDDDNAPGSPAASDQSLPPPAVAAPAPAPLAALESSLERVAREMLRQQRSDRRWRVFFRLAWLGLVLAVAWAVFSQRAHVQAGTKAHTALIGCRARSPPATRPVPRPWCRR